MKNNAEKYSIDDLQTWLAERVADYVRRKPEDIQADVQLAEYGLDSVFVLALTGDIEDHLGLTLEPTIMWDYPTIGELSAVLSELISASQVDNPETITA